jgi:hypothetical protein
MFVSLLPCDLENHLQLDGRAERKPRAPPVTITVFRAFAISGLFEAIAPDAVANQSRYQDAGRTSTSS